MDPHEPAPTDISRRTHQVHMTSAQLVSIAPGPNGFAEDKDYARDLRLEVLLPAFERGDEVIIDFTAVSFSTQSFVHALIGEVLKRHGERALEQIEFKGCGPQVREMVGLVVDYSLGGFDSPSDDIGLREDERR
jgi:hypothetical protein